MAMSAGSSGGVKAAPNVTPMIDVMLVLLIIFMLVIPAITSGFQAIPPTGVNLKPHPEEDQDQVLGIDANGQYYLNKQPIRYDDIAPRIKQIYSGREDKSLYIKADKNLDYCKVLDLLDIAAKNGVVLTAIITDQKPGTASTVAGDVPVQTPVEGGH